MTDRFARAAVEIADRLCEEAVIDGNRATWIGSQMQMVDEDWEPVDAAVGPELYGGTAGVGLFLARTGASIGTGRHLDHARMAITHALGRVGELPDGSLHGGSSGVVAAAAEVARLLGDDELATSAAAVSIPDPDAADLIAGSAGMVLAALELARHGDAEAWHTRASAWGEDLLRRSEQNDDGTLRWWPSDIGADEPPLLGLGHGASGCAWALAELAVATRRDDLLDAALQAVAYERTFLDHDRGNWPDLRELSEQAVAEGAEPSWPVFWCHGATGIGLVRLRLFEITGDRRHRDEAELAIVGALRFSVEVAGEQQLHDLSLCHGLAAVVELAREAGRVLRDPGHVQSAHEVAAIALEMASAASNWPSGVRGGGENPSLMLGMAGIGGALANLAVEDPAPYGLLWAGREHAVRVSAKLTVADAVPQVAARLAGEYGGLRLERASKSGRMLLNVAATADVSDVVARLNADPDLAWAELEGTDRPA